MAVVYKINQDIMPEQAQALFRSVGWLSGEYPTRLAKALRGSDTVVSAWDGEQLVGLANAIDDGELTAYMHYLLVDPAYHGQGVGRALVCRIKEIYADYLYLLLMCDEKKNIPFYEQYGFRVAETTPMMIMTEGNQC